MGISGAQHALTLARAGLLRSGAGRSDYPIKVGVKVKTYALSNIARSGATRSDYHSGLPFIVIGGVHYGTGRADAHKGILISDFEIEDTINETPSTLGLTAIGFIPAIGAEVIVTLGSKNNPAREFAGTVLAREYDYAGKPPNYRHRISCIDYTWGLNTRKITKRYTATAVGTILADLLATYAPAYTFEILPELAATVLDEITYTNEDLIDAITRLMKRAGGNWYCDHTRVIRAFFGIDPWVQPPGILNAVNPSLLHFTFTRDLSQYLTRVYVEGGGANAYGVPAGSTLLPVEDPSWYPPSGVVVSGPQRITYTGVLRGGGGALVGPGAAPSQRPILARAPGPGLANGTYWFSFTYVTATGESKSSPAMWIVMGPAAPPTDIPTIGTAQPGTGPNTGTHEYAVTFLTATGETTPGPTVSASTTEIDKPAEAPVPDPPSAGAGLEDGDHAYAVTFVTDVGETVAGPISATVRTGSRVVPTVAPTPALPRSGSGPDPGDHKYALTYEYGDAETQAGPLSGTVTTRAALPKVNLTPSATVNLNFLTPFYKIGDSVKFSLIWVNSRGEYAGESPASAMFTAVACTVPGGTQYAACYDLTNLETSADPQVTEKWLYLWVNGARSVIQRVAPFYFSLQACFSSGGSYYGYGGMPPLVSGATCIVDLTNLQAAPAGVGIKNRKLYRTAAGGSQLKFLASFSATVDPQVTTYTDTKSDASLGANIPSGAATATSQVNVRNIVSGPGGLGIKKRKLYRRDGAGPLKLVVILEDNTTRTYMDTKSAASLGESPPTVNGAVNNRIPLSNIPLGEPGIVTGRAIYRTPAGGGALLRAITIPDNTTKTAVDTVPDASLGPAAPGVNTADANQVAVSGIAVGADTVVSRILYRSAVNDTTLKRRAVIGDNTTTTFLDAAPDSALGSQGVPTTDLSGLAQPSGVVSPGSTQLIVASTAAFNPAGGLVIIGNGQQVIRYTGISGNALIGVPAIGPGSITASVSYSSTATEPPTLTGIPSSGEGAIKWPIPTGDPVNLWVQVDDLPARAALAALLGTDGIVEDVITDNRLSYTEALARGRAHLAERAAIRVTVRYRTRDRKTGAGAPVTINLGDPINLQMQTFLIQRVVQSAMVDQKPVYEVDASSTLYSFEELLRLIKKGA